MLKRLREKEDIMNADDVQSEQVNDVTIPEEVKEAVFEEQVVPEVKPKSRAKPKKGKGKVSVKDPVDAAETVTREEVEEESKRVLFNPKTVQEAFNKGGSAEVAQQFQGVGIIDKQGLLEFKLENKRGGNEYVTLNHSGDIVCSQKNKEQSFKNEEEWSFIRSVVGFGSKEGPGSEIKFTLVPAGLELQLAYTEGYWCIGNASDPYMNRHRYGSKELEKVLETTLYDSYSIRLSDLDQKAVYNLILSHRDIAPVEVNQVFLVSRYFNSQKDREQQESIALPRLQEFRVSTVCTKQETGDLDSSFIEKLVRSYSNMALSVASPVSHIRAKCGFMEWELETPAGEAMRLHREATDYKEPFDEFAKDYEGSYNAFISLMSVYSSARRNRNTYKNEEQRRKPRKTDSSAEE